MDNLTHSLTGAVTAKFIESQRPAPEEKSTLRRTFFWLFVISANIPDIDVLLGFLGDPILSIKYHRALTHSLLFAPVLALLPAGVFRLFSAVDNIRLLWVISLLGVVTHIFFDLVTSFGTQILLPLSETRYALDWLFIIDPVLLLLLAVFLLTGKLKPSWKRTSASLGIAVVVLYVVIAAVSHGVARKMVQDSVRHEGLTWSRISVLPQPLSVFRWQGLVQDEGSVRQVFFSILDDSVSEFEVFHQSQDDAVLRALREPDVEWYGTFARHPWVRSFREGERQVVVFRDLMYSVDDALLTALGFTERSLPFELRYEYDASGNQTGVWFDGSKVER